MARTAARGFCSQVRGFARNVGGCLGAVALLATLTVPTASFAAPATRPAAPASLDPVKGEATMSDAGGFARLVFKFSEDVAAEVTAAGAIIVIHFERPVDITADRLAESLPGYIAGVRSDPDGSAIRLSLARRVTVNTMQAGERTFVDLLPDSWTGPPPPLPIEVVRELADRARAAERALRQQRTEIAAKKRGTVRVRALLQPTFVRFVFEMPDGVGISSMFNDQRLTLTFNAPLIFDLADPKIVAPSNIASINQRIEGDKTMVDIDIIGDSDIHSFREEKNYNIDVTTQQDKKAAEIPAAEAPSAEKKKPAETEKHSEAIVPPTSETIAREAKVETKPETKPELAAPVKSETAKPEAPSHGPEATPHAEAKPAPETPPVAEAKKENAAPPAIAEAPKTAAPAIAKVAEAPAPAILDDDEKSTSTPAPGAVGVDAWRDSNGLRVTFSFPDATPAASFRRGDTVWLIFDSSKPIDVDPIRAKGGALIGDVGLLALDNAQAIRIRLNRPQMHSVSTDEKASGAVWTLSLADKVQNPPRPLMVTRNIADPSLANVAVGLDQPGMLHRIVDPDAGDTLLVVTAAAPVRGFIKRQDFVDFALLESAHGVAIRPNSDDVRVEVSPASIIIGRNGGLTLSPADTTAERAPTAVRPLFDIEEWRTNQAGNFSGRQSALIQAIAQAAPDQRPQARLDLVRFYMARGMYYEARGEADVALADPLSKKDDVIPLTLHAVASILIDRPGRGLKDLASPTIGSKYDAQMWQALALARQGKWAEAREKFKNVEFAVAVLPLDLQRLITLDAMRASLEVKDFAGAAKRNAELETMGLPAESQAAGAVLRGRLAEALGQERDALDAYKIATDSEDRKAAAEATLLTTALKLKRDEIKQPDALRDLETLSMIWRGDATEVKTLQTLAQIYDDNGRFFDSLQAARMATKLSPNSDMSRSAQDRAQSLFAQVFLSEKGDNLPPIDALSLFYEFRELTPIGRRGDEMIRRLSDRLVSVDLLDQAAELLQYQVDKRLEGAARAQVAAKLAMVYLSNRKPDLAIAALRSTRIADLAGELRQQRLLLEARGQSDIGRHDLALDIVSNIGGREAIRLRSDIYWAARRWREASEQIELYYGDRWRDFKPLASPEKSDMIRAVVGYALAEDAIGMARFRDKYAPLMTGGADKIAFDMAGKPGVASTGEFAAIAKLAAGVDTLDGFLRDMKTRFPDNVARAPLADPNSTGSLPAGVAMRRVGG